MVRLRRLLIVLLPVLFASAAHADNGARDPWQGFNRSVFTFNDWFDDYIGKPAARGYRWVTPDVVDNHVTYFLRNISDVTNVVNFALQGDGRQALDSTGRVIANTSLGLAGIFDVASRGGIPRRETDFGVTLGKWGFHSGPYLVLPFFGPSSVRDAFSIPFDWAIGPIPQPWTVVDDEAIRYGLETLYLVDKRADLLTYEQVVIGDRYTFLRDAFLQNRDYEIGGGTNVDPFLDDDSESDSEEPGEDAAQASPGDPAEPDDPGAVAEEAGDSTDPVDDEAADATE